MKNLKIDSLVKAVRPDSTEVESQMIVLQGFVGESSEKGYFRLYLDEALNSFMDIPDDACLHAVKVKTADDVECTKLWISSEAEYVYGSPKAENRPKAKFAEGDLLNSYNINYPGPVEYTPHPTITNVTRNQFCITRNNFCITRNSQICGFTRQDCWFTRSTDCRPCKFRTRHLPTGGGCGINYSTLPPTTFRTDVIRTVDVLRTADVARTANVGGGRYMPTPDEPIAPTLTPHTPVLMGEIRLKDLQDMSFNQEWRPY